MHAELPTVGVGEPLEGLAVAGLSSGEHRIESLSLPFVSVDASLTLQHHRHLRFIAHFGSGSVFQPSHDRTSRREAQDGARHHPFARPRRGPTPSLGILGDRGAVRGATLPAPCGVSRPTLRRWRAFALLVVAYFMTVVDLTIVNVALPTIGIKLHFPESDLQWVVTAYGLTFGGFLLLGGRAADLLGRRRMLMAGRCRPSSLPPPSLVGSRNSDTLLIVMRGIQGFGAAIAPPAALSIVMNIFPEGSEPNKALGIWGAMGAEPLLEVGLFSG